MKTPRQADRRNQSNTDRSSHAVRRQRTLATFTCESLEGRKLMTGFAGAAGMMGHGPVDFGGMTDAGQTGTGDLHRHDRMSSDMMGAGADQTTDDQSGSTASADAQGTTATTTSTGSDDAHFNHDMMTRDGDHPDFKFQRSGDDASFGGMGQGDDMGGAAEIPMNERGSMGDQGDQGTQGTGNTQLDTDLTKLQTDSQAIHDKSQVTPALLASVRKDLEAIDKAKTGTADATALKTLQTDEQAIFGTSTTTDGSTGTDGSTATGGSTASSTPTPPTKPTDAQIAQLQADHDAVLKSQGVSQTLIDQLAADRLAVKTASNFTADDQATLDADHKAIDADRATMQTQDAAGNATPDAAQAATAATTDGTATTTATTADAATPTAATPDPASQAAPAPDASANPPTPVAATAAPNALDPTMTQVTSTAAPMAATGMDQMTAPGHHGRPGFNHHAMGIRLGQVTRSGGWPGSLPTPDGIWGSDRSAMIRAARPPALGPTANRRIFLSWHRGSSLIGSVTPRMRAGSHRGASSDPLLAVAQRTQFIDDPGRCGRTHLGAIRRDPVAIESHP